MSLPPQRASPTRACPAGMSALCRLGSNAQCITSSCCNILPQSSGMPLPGCVTTSCPALLRASKPPARQAASTHQPSDFRCSRPQDLPQQPHDAQIRMCYASAGSGRPQLQSRIAAANVTKGLTALGGSRHGSDWLAEHRSTSVSPAMLTGKSGPAEAWPVAALWHQEALPKVRQNCYRISKYAGILQCAAPCAAPGCCKHGLLE